MYTLRFKILTKKHINVIEFILFMIYTIIHIYVIILFFISYIVQHFGKRELILN